MASEAMHTKMNQQSGSHTRIGAAVLATVLTCLLNPPASGLIPRKAFASMCCVPGPRNKACLKTRFAPFFRHTTGFWIGTLGGLARFDGASFVLYKAGAPGSIPGESITGLAEDRDNSLWISSGGGLTCYRDRHSYNYSRCGPRSLIWSDPTEFSYLLRLLPPGNHDHVSAGRLATSGTGVGTLAAADVGHLCRAGRSLNLAAYEIAV